MDVHVCQFLHGWKGAGSGCSAGVARVQGGCSAGVARGDLCAPEHALRRLVDAPNNLLIEENRMK